MLNFKDILLLVAVFGSLGLALAWPDLGAPLAPLLIYFLISLLFLSFLQLNPQEIWSSWKNHGLILLLMGIIKLVALPLVLYFPFYWFWPEYALPVLLLSGISTGVVAPFISGLVGAQTPLVLGLVVLTSLVVPFSLPVLVKLLAGEELRLSFAAMFRVLALIIFLPAFLALIMKKISPGLTRRIGRIRYPLSLIFFALINQAVFSRYQDFFRARPQELLNAALIAYLLSIVFHGVGWGLSWGQEVGVRLAQAVSLAYVNNILVVVFSAQFFGPLSPTLAAMYLLPFFTLIVPLRLLGERSSESLSAEAGSFRVRGAKGSRIQVKNRAEAFFLLDSSTP
ncbi:MAG: bile acid:sodium symporter [Deltaproteobacteria bacterium]|nr:bile acid:sodium symporter [Deltaproteobacteria bacterium]